MPLDATGHWMNDKVVSQDEILGILRTEFELEQVPARGAAPADRWRYVDAAPTAGGSTVGIIPTVTKPFCGDCDRVRLTADGQFRTCLFATDEFDFRALMRAGATDDDIAMEIQRAVGRKWAGHQINQVSFVRPARSMSQIGG
jgi:cyclic pyranopterin phosphate synthase